MSTRIKWKQFKSCVNSKGLLIQYVESNRHYSLVAFDGNYKILSILDKLSAKHLDDVSDFEANYKKSANAKIGNLSFNLDERLRTETLMPAEFGNLPLVDNRFSIDVVTNVNVVNDSWATVYEFSGKGIFYSFALSLSGLNNVTARLIVDGRDVLNGNLGISINDIIDGAGYLSSTIDTVIYNMSGSSGIKFNENIDVKIKSILGAETFKKGLISLVKL